MTAARCCPLALFPFALVLAGSLLGCKDEPATLQTAKPTETPSSGPFDLKPPAKPAKADPEAKTKLDAMIAAHTGGKPERLAKLKSCSFTRHGLIMNDGPRTAVQTIDLDWPNRYKYRSEITLNGQNVFQAGLTPTLNWRFPGEPDPTKALPDKPEKQKLDGDITVTVRRQMQEDALFLLFPFLEPETVVTTAEGDTIGEKECFGLHVWTPALDYALVHVDKAGSQLARLAYRGREGRAEVVKIMVFEEFQEFGGVKLGSKIYLKAAGNDLASWRSLSVTLGKTFDPTYFDNP